MCSATASLSYAKHLKNPEYVLSKAVNVLELMDPKLDPGVAAAGPPVAQQQPELSSLKQRRCFSRPRSEDRLAHHGYVAAAGGEAMACSRGCCLAGMTSSRAHHLIRIPCFAFHVVCRALG